LFKSIAYTELHGLISYEQPNSTKKDCKKQNSNNNKSMVTTAQSLTATKKTSHIEKDQLQKTREPPAMRVLSKIPVTQSLVCATITTDQSC